MSNLKKHLKSDKFKWILTGLAMVLIIGILVSVCVSLNNLHTTRNVGRSDYAITSISATTGKNVDSKQHIAMKDAKTVDGLEITLGENAQITYKVAFYDEDGKFVSMTDAQSEDFDNTNIPATAKTFRVEITPNQVDGKDVTITIWNIGNYTSQITIVYNK